MKKSDLQSNLTKSIQESTKTVQNTINLIPELEQAIITMVKCISKGHKIVLFGNGGSAADAQHIAAELIGRFKLKRKSLPAIALTTDTSCITALSNDYSFDIIFRRQCESLVQKGDVVIGISTSGNSKNVLKVASYAILQKKCFDIGMPFADFIKKRRVIDCCNN